MEGRLSLLPNERDSLTSKDLIKLSALRRSIAGFVQLLTNKNIPVEFIEKDSSFTDYHKVFITANITNNNLDSIVGLALHEGSHIHLTTFSLLYELNRMIPKVVYEKAKSLGMTEEYIQKFFKGMLNWIEDRRIDRYVQDNAEGWVGYYIAMYDRYFNSPIVNVGLQSDLYLQEDIQSYEFHIINSQNPNFNKTALKSLEKIINSIDVDNINKLKSTKDSFTKTLDVINIILESIKPFDPSKEPKDGEGESGDGNGDNYVEDISNIDDDGNMTSDAEDNGSNGSGSGGIGKQIAIGKDGKQIDGSGNGKPIKLSPKAAEKLRKFIEKQKDFINGETNKVGIDKGILEKLKDLAEAGSEIKQVDANEHQEGDGKGKATPKNEFKRIYDVLVIKNVTTDFFMSNGFPFSQRYDEYTSSVVDGLALGSQLGKKLKVRNEERVTKFSRKLNGRLDKRLISEIGFGNAQVFQQSFVETYSNVYLHISIDVSGSMSGISMANSIKTTIAICKAIDMSNENMDVTISLRGTDGSSPCIAIIYDSRKDKFSKLRRILPYINANSATPEGLCFAAIDKFIVESTCKLKSYFLNISDGEPAFSGYGGELAAYHTRGEVNKMRNKGVDVLSYFISDNGYGMSYGRSSIFDIMYGRSARYIDTNSVLQIAKTLNDLFLKKD